MEPRVLMALALVVVAAGVPAVLCQTNAQDGECSCLAAGDHLRFFHR
jgi:hypothetical protein